MRKIILLGVCLLLVAATWLLKPAAHAPVGNGTAESLHPANAPTNAVVAAHSPVTPRSALLTGTNRLALRLTNTPKTVGELTTKPHAILLANALLDTDLKLDLNIPDHLRAAAEPGAFIVQARGVIDGAFRSLLARAGGQVVSYIPNNAYLVKLTAAQAATLTGNPSVQAVLPYEPYFKVQSSLLRLEVKRQPLPPGTALTLGLFAADAADTEQQVVKLGAKIISRDQSPFGPVLRVLPPAKWMAQAKDQQDEKSVSAVSPSANWTALAALPGLQVMEPVYQKSLANDLSRATVGVAADTQTSSNFLNLTGANVLVAVNDSGIDNLHPDLKGRVLGAPVTDQNGHGTHVAGTIAGDGTESTTVINAQGSLMPGTNGQFRGMAPKASLYAVDWYQSDYVSQTNAAVAGALISNNGWNYAGDADYDLAAASYDAATRDALPGVTGSQPVLFVFSAGNSGGGTDNGYGGSADTILSPGTAKNVITVGALELPRNITNIVSVVYGGTTNTSTPWQPQTDSSVQVAGYSGRGNVGVGTEGDAGRFKPDVMTPGTFVVSTRSGLWDTNAYYNPTNTETFSYLNQRVPTNGLNYYSVMVPPNAGAVSIVISSNRFSNPFPANLPIYVQQSGYPDPNGNPGGIDIITHRNGVSIPPDSGGAIGGIQDLQNNGFAFAVGNSTNAPVNYDLTVTISLTNNVGDYYSVLQQMNDNDLGKYYRYETGTSMSAAEVSGVLALLQDFFTNQLHQAPSPALLKAMLINGSRSLGSYSYAVTNGLNYQGWGLVNLANSLPLTTSNLTSVTGANAPMFFRDQDTNNALATGDSHTYIVNVNTDAGADYLPLLITLVWTDPCGDPVAATKLVNNLDLVVSNLDTGDVYFGNNISINNGYSQPVDTNAVGDTVNNVENVFLQPQLGSRYSITVVGRAVNVNAVTAHPNSVVQDYALVVTCGEGEVPDAITSVTDNGVIRNPTGGQLITVVTTTNTPLFGQFAGASSPLLGTNTLPLGNNTMWGSGGQLTVGMTNQWHFYIVTNNGPAADYTNAAFITFQSSTLSLPREGVFANSTDDATRPEADIDLYVSQNPGLLDLNPAVIADCLAGVNGARAALTQSGTEFVYYTDSAPGKVYYVGVKSEDRMAAEYAFMPIFTDTPFGSLLPNGNQQVNGLLLPVPIPDGSNARPGVTNVFALAIYPMIAAKVKVTSLNEHENFGDLFGVLRFGGTSVVLNNHDGYGNTIGAVPLVYDDSLNPVAGTRHTDGPGSLTDYRTKSALGPWILTMMDDAPTHVGQVSRFSLEIQPHRDLTVNGQIVTVPAHGWFIDYVDVPPGYTNLLFAATNLDNAISPPRPPLQMYERFGDEPTLTLFDQTAGMSNCPPPLVYPAKNAGNTISVGPPLPNGQYFIGLYNPSGADATNVFLKATLSFDKAADVTFNYNSTDPTPLPDDAVVGSSIAVGATQLVASVNVGMVVNAERISDYTFTLVSPTGQRILLMENRGGTDTNGAGSMFIYTNIVNAVASGGFAPDTNFIETGLTSGSLPIRFIFYGEPDQMTVYYGTNAANFYLGSPYLLFDSGMIPTSGWVTTNVVWPGAAPADGSTMLTIIMNQFGNPTNTTIWNYTAGAVITNYQYLMFTDDINLATVPIKFAEPPYNLLSKPTNPPLILNFESATNGTYIAPASIPDLLDGWTVPTNLVQITSNLNLATGQFGLVTNTTVLVSNRVSVVTDPANAAGGSNLLALANGTILRSLPTVPGHIYTVTFNYRGPGIAGWWRGEGNATDSSGPENYGNNGALVGRFNFPAGKVGQAFEFADQGDQFGFAGTNTYVQIPQSPSLDVGRGGGFTVEGWIAPTNLTRPQPLVEWLAKVPENWRETNALTNIVIRAGPVRNPATGHFYYLLGATNWTTSELWATQLGGHLVTLETANEQNWVLDNFGAFHGDNHNLWIGLTNNIANHSGWIGGLPDTGYRNWQSGQPNNSCGTAIYTAVYGGTNAQPGLWFAANNNGTTCGSPVTNLLYGVVEVNALQTNGVQFWISTTNLAGGTGLPPGGGRLYANLVDTNNVSHEIVSAPGLLLTNVYQHVALTYDTNSGVAQLYLNGTNVATTNFGAAFVPKTGGDVLLGRDITTATNNYYFGGRMDEMSIYNRALSGAELYAIWRVSATATNGLAGKFDPAITPPYSLAGAAVVFGNATNIIYGLNDAWSVNSYTFVAESNAMPLRITGLAPGMLLDAFTVRQAPLTNLYYFPEQALASLIGDSAYGNWTLQVWDNRVGAYLTNLTDLVSWQLSFVLQSNAMFAANLQPQAPSTSTVGPGQTVYYSVTVPDWAQRATNVLVSSTLPVNLWFNSTYTQPNGSNPGDVELLTGATNGPGLPSLDVNGAPNLPLQPGGTYYLGVHNPGDHAATVVLEVDYDIVALTNGVPFSSYLTNAVSATFDPGAARYFSYDVSTNAGAATFQLLQLTGNADLVVRKGTPLPTLRDCAYGSFSAGRADENIYVLTNSVPVPLTPGRWYLGVIRRDAGPLNYTVLAKELDTNTSYSIVELTNNVPVNFTSGPGAALTNFFHFAGTNLIIDGITNQAVRFEVYNLTGNGDLTVQTNRVPLSPPFFQSSQNRGRLPEMVLIFTNNVLANLQKVSDWYLGVPNNEGSEISYTVIAEVLTNGYFPAFPGASGAGGGAQGGRFGDVYHVTLLEDSGPGTLREAVSAGNRTVVFDVSGTINLTSELVITNSYLTLAGQTAPGGGITVAGNMTTLAGLTDVIIRNVRFRRGAVDDSLRLSNVADVIADHVSVEWSDTTLSTIFADKVTVQWSIIADSLLITTNPAPSGSVLSGYGGKLSFHHNLYANHYSGSPQLRHLMLQIGGLFPPLPGTGSDNRQTLDFVNNVVYNWGLFAGLCDGTNDLLFSPLGFTNQLNYVCNYLIAGPDTALSATPIAFNGGVTNALTATWVFQTNNFIDSNRNGLLDGANTQWRMFTNCNTQFERPFPVLPVPTDEAFIAYEKVLALAGVPMAQRDAADVDIVGGVRNESGRITSGVLSAPPLPGMVGWWKGDGNTVDSIAGNDGVGYGVVYTNGMVGQAFSFPRIGGWWGVQIPDSPAYILTNAFTVEAWVRPTEACYNIFWRGDSRPGLDPITLEMEGNNSLLFCFNDSNNNQAVVRTTLAFGQWAHVAATFDASTGRMCIYTNGLLAAVTVTSLRPIGALDPNLHPGVGIGNVNDGFNNGPFIGDIDEVSLYKRALSPAEIQSIYKAGSAGKFGALTAGGPIVNPYLDTDQDGLPDFWEQTFGSDRFTPDSGYDRTGSGYTDLEDYLNWLAAPHALTVTNTPVGVDLMQMFGSTGNLSFMVTNGVNGSVYLTNVLNGTINTGAFSNSIAWFTPAAVFSGGTHNYGRASFETYVTNNDTHAYFGPVTVSVVVSKVPILINSNWPPNIITLTNRIAYTNSNAAGSDFYKFTVPPNQVGVLYELLNPSGNMALVARYGLPLPSLSSYDYISTNPGTANGSIIVTTNSTPVVLTPGDWYLAAVNVSGGPVTYAARATLFTNIVPPVFLSPTNGNVFSLIETTLFATNCAGYDTNTPTLPLTYKLVQGPTNMMVSTAGVINWTPTEAQGPSTNTIQISLSNGALAVTNTFTIIVWESNLPPVLPVIPDQRIGPGLMVISNAAADPDIPINALTYVLTQAPPGAAIDGKGTITWLAKPSDIGSTYDFTTVVTDDNPWAINAQHLSDTNHFRVFVVPVISEGTFTNIMGTNGFLLVWFAPSNCLFQVQWTTNLASPAWNTFTNIVSYDPAAFSDPSNTKFDFFDDGSQTGGLSSVRFYRLVLLTANTNLLMLPVLGNLTVSNGAAMTVTNQAILAPPGAVLTYSLINPPAGAGISSNGIITWTAGPDGLAARFNTRVTTDGTPPLTATNAFTVFVGTLPGIGNVSVTATNVTLTWTAPAADQFQVRWSTNLITWIAFPGVVTSATGNFSFTDNSPSLVMKFYQLILLP